MFDKFDKTKPNVILISDFTETVFLAKSIGVYKVARELRLAGFEVAVLHHAHVFEFEEILHILNHLISDKTLFVGFNNMFYKTFTKQTANELHKGGVVYGERELGSMLPHGVDYNQRLRDFIKNKNPNCKLVLGGPTASDISDNKIFDYVVVGYADISAVNLTEHLNNSLIKLNKSYKSIHGPIIVNDAKADGFDFANSAMAYKSYDCILPRETMTMEIGRGCIFNCAFCSYPLNGKKKLDFIKCSDNILKEMLENYERYGVTRYQMLDDTFNDSIEKVRMMSDISKKLPFKLEYWAYLRLDLMTAHPETVDLLFDSGLRGCFFGIETFNKETGSIIGKGMSMDRMVDTLRYIKSKWGDEVMLHGSFIAGLPKESKDSLYRTFDILMADDRPLDSWIMRGFHLDDRSVNDDGFFSRIALDPEKFGYKNLQKIPNMNYLYWENEHMNFYESVEIATKFTDDGERLGRRKLAGFASFMVSGLDYDLEFTRNKPIIEIDWHQIDSRKWARAKQYKKMFYSAFDLPDYEKLL